MIKATKKTSKTKPKVTRSKDPIENIGAPEMENLKIRQDNESQSSDKSTTDIVSLKYSYVESMGQ